VKTLVRCLSLTIFLTLSLFAANDVTPDAAHQISPEELVKVLQGKNAKALLILNVGPRTLFDQAHIPGSEYIGAASSAEGLGKLKDRVKSLPHDAAISLYCGCCPWDHCPNVRPAYSQLHQMGFSNVQVLYIAHNIGSDWVDKGYPIERGK
jgi:thiosulfate/3-mercaptopyruvate sulfurtransferase